MIKFHLFLFGAVVKRLFYSMPEFAFAIAMMPFVFFFDRSRINRRLFIYYLIASLIVFVRAVTGFALNRPLPYHYLLILMSLFIFLIQKDIRFQRPALLTFLFMISTLFYGVYQKYVGYFPWDVGFLLSEFSSVDAKGYLAFDDRRANGMMAGVPEATLFYLGVSHFFINSRKYVPFLLAIFGAYISGSRGVFVSFLLSSVFVGIIGFQISWRRIVSFMFLAILVYLFLAFILPLTEFLALKNDSNRLLVYGTFGYRVSLLVTFISEFRIENVFSPLSTEVKFFDNFYLTVVKDFGLLGGLTFLVCVIVIIKSLTYRSSAVYLYTFISTLLYTDQVFSVYFMITLLFAIVLNRSYGFNAKSKTGIELASDSK